jgi:hypothetical protein
VVPAARELRGGRGICGEKVVGFACFLADRAGPSSFFSRPDSPSAPREAGDGLGSPDGFRPFFGGKRGTRGRARLNNVVRMKKWCRGPRQGDGWRCSKKTDQSVSWGECGGAVSTSRRRDLRKGCMFRYLHLQDTILCGSSLVKT